MREYSLSDIATAKTPEAESFDCRRCGQCCRGSGGIVTSDGDLQRLCRHLHLSPAAFEKAWGERHGNKLHIRAGENGFCVFFREGRGCAVHEAKPDICRAWPYFRGNLLDEGSLELSNQFCPGIPASLSHADFVRQGLACLEREGLVGSAGADEANALQVADLMASIAKTDNTR